MSYYVGLDVSMDRTAICVLDTTGSIVLERSVASNPQDIVACLHFCSRSDLPDRFRKPVHPRLGFMENSPSRTSRFSVSKSGK